MNELAMSMNPEVIGWTEFWVRLVFVSCVLAGSLLIATMILKALASVLRGVAWLLEKAKNNE